MPMNVKEQITLTDTVLISKHVGQMADPPSGWYTNFAAAGNAGLFPFFNVRNRNIGVMYNNQDARDQLPYGMRINDIGVKFFAPPCASQFTACENVGSTAVTRTPYPDTTAADPDEAELTNREELHSAIWEADLPQHVSLELRTNQDTRLKGTAIFFSPGYGPVGGGWGWGSPGTWTNAASGTTAIPCATLVSNQQTVEHGSIDLRKRFPFPHPIDVPKRANLSVLLKLSPYAKSLLEAMTGPYWWAFPGYLDENRDLVKVVKSSAFGIQVTLRGERLVQQRGDYHV